MVSIRPFEGQDARALAKLMAEMVAFYGASIAPDLAVPDDINRQAKTVDILVALVDGELLGFATSTTLYPVAGLIAFTYVQQIYVALKARRLGIAQQLMAAVAWSAKAKGIQRVEWSTGHDNTAARALYDGLGAIGTEKVSYTLTGAELDRLAMTHADRDLTEQVPGVSRQTIASGYPYEDEYGYSRAVRVGNQVFVSGTTARPPHLDGDAYEQAKAILSIVEDALGQAGAALHHVVRTVVYVVDMTDSPLVARAHAEAFGQIRPTSTLVQVVALTPNTARVEVEATTVVDD